jgi:putative heme-binding domain-containing protein
VESVIPLNLIPLRYEIMFHRRCLLLVVVVHTLLSTCTFSQHDSHGDARKIEPPKVFLDKSPKVVEYQLKRLSNAQLLLIQTATDDPKFTPVFSAILTRPGMSVEQRQGAAEGLAKISRRSIAEVLLESLAKLSAEDRSQLRVASEMTEILLRQKWDEPTVTTLKQSAASDSQLARRAAMAGLIQSDHTDIAQQLATSDPKLRQSFLGAIAIVPDPSKRISLRPEIVKAIDRKTSTNIIHQAISSLAAASTDADANDNVNRLMEFIQDPDLSGSAVQSLLSVGFSKLDAGLAAKLATALVVRAEATPADLRTADSFVDASQLIDKLLPKLPESESRSLRQRMREIAVRVVRIKTVEEEMRYDIKYFVAEAGKPIQILLQNADLMPHNLVITKPGALKAVAMTAATMAPDALTNGKQYVPALPEVLFATKMIQAGKSDRLTIEAPKEPGEYPFVCTYPNHWMRMYGVMVVVPDVDAFLQMPVEPKDPVGNNRSFVKNWKMADFEGKVTVGLKGRSKEIGQKLFQEGTCLQCHVVAGKGGRVGPDLHEVLKRHQGSAESVLREIIEPSHKIDPKYASHSVLTLDGQVYSGVIVAEDEKSVSLLSSPDQPKPTVIQRSDIDDMVPSPKSMMPAALMDQFSQEEIFELLAYVLEI